VSTGRIRRAVLGSVVALGIALGAVFLVVTPASATTTASAMTSASVVTATALTSATQPSGTQPSTAQPATTQPTTTVPPIGVGVTIPGASGSAGTGTATTSPTTSGGCGLLDVSCHVTSAIDNWFKDLVTSALDPVLGLLGHTLLATPNVTAGQVGSLWAITAAIANSLVVLLVLIGGAIVMSHETLQTKTTAKDLAPRIVVGVIAANASLAVVGLGIGVANALAGALLGGGVDPANATSALDGLVNSSLSTGGIFLVLMGLVAAVLAVVLVATYVIRVALLTLLVIAAPLALICHVLPQTEGMAKLWWRGIAGLFTIQLAQSLVLITSLRIFFATGGSSTLGLSSSGGLVDVLVACCLLWVLVRIPSWVSRKVFAGSGHSAVGKGVKTLLVYRVVRAGIGALG
jgi:hypothetical protein